MNSFIIRDVDTRSVNFRWVANNFCINAKTICLSFVLFPYSKRRQHKNRPVSFLDYHTSVFKFYGGLSHAGIEERSTTASTQQEINRIALMWKQMTAKFRNIIHATERRLYLLPLEEFVIGDDSFILLHTYSRRI